MNKIVVLPFYTGEILASGNFTTSIIDLDKYSNEWRFSLQQNVTGDGTLKTEILGSADGITFVDLGIDVDDDAVKTGGPGGDGKYPPTAISLTFCRFIKLYFSEVGAANSVYAYAYLAIQ